MMRYKSENSMCRAGLFWVSAVLLLTGCAQTPSFEPGTLFYPAPPESPRIQFLTAITDEVDIGVEKDAFMEFVTGKTEAVMNIARPWDIDHLPGKLYIVDKTYRRVLIIDLENTKFEFVESAAGGPLLNPGGIFVSKSGYKYVADRDRRQIVVYDQSNKFTRVFEAGPEFQPVDVVVYENRLYACDVNEEVIKIFDRTSGQLIDTITGSGEIGGKFRLPSHLTIDEQGNLYVTDFLNFRVQKFDSNGNFVKTIGESGDFPGAMPRPKGIAVDREDHLYAVDSAFEVVQVFDTQTGTVLMPFGKFGSLSGGTWLPAGIHIDYDNMAYFSEFIDPGFRARYLIYVLNQAGPFKLNVYAFGEWVGTEPVPGVRSGATTK